MTKKHNKHKKNKRSNTKLQRKLLFAVVILTITTMVGFISGWLGYELGTTTEEPQQQAQSQLKSAQQQIRELQARLKDLDSAKQVVIEKKNVVVNFLTESGDYGAHEEKPPPPPVKKIEAPMPLVAIVIDDVAYKHQLQKIENLPIAVTPSIFPPAKDFTTTPKLARYSKHYMIHLPMQSKSYPKYALKDTLTVGNGDFAMEQRIRNLRRWFPEAKYINNHTGSAFTEDFAAMKRLYRVMKKYNFTFIDSRTTPKTVVPRLAKNHGETYLRRDVFLDNKREEAYILGQIKKTIEIAKEHGSAMAIGHPHSVTLDTLAKAKGLFEGVKVVYIDEFVQSLM